LRSRLTTTLTPDEVSSWYSSAFLPASLREAGLDDGSSDEEFGAWLTHFDLDVRARVTVEALIAVRSSLTHGQWVSALADAPHLPEEEDPNLLTADDIREGIEAHSGERVAEKFDQWVRDRGTTLSIDAWDEAIGTVREHLTRETYRRTLRENPHRRDRDGDAIASVIQDQLPHLGAWAPGKEHLMVCDGDQVVAVQRPYPHCTFEELLDQFKCVVELLADAVESDQNTIHHLVRGGMLAARIEAVALAYGKPKLMVLCEQLRELLASRHKAAHTGAGEFDVREALHLLEDIEVRFAKLAGFDVSKDRERLVRSRELDRHEEALWARFDA